MMRGQQNVKKKPYLKFLFRVKLQKFLRMMTVSDNNIYLSEQKYITTYITITSTSVTLLSQLQ